MMTNLKNTRVVTTQAASVALNGRSWSGVFLAGCLAIVLCGLGAVAIRLASGRPTKIAPKDTIVDELQGRRTSVRSVPLPTRSTSDSRSSAYSSSPNRPSPIEQLSSKTLPVQDWPGASAADIREETG